MECLHKMHFTFSFSNGFGMLTGSSDVEFIESSFVDENFLEMIDVDQRDRRAKPKNYNLFKVKIAHFQ